MSSIIRMFNNMFLRNVLTDLGIRSAHSADSESFTPYFQYRVGSYQQDYFLYFPKEPYQKRYKNEIFNKLMQYSGYDMIQYLEFHFGSYPDKTDFLKFMQYELSERLKKNIAAKYRVKFEAALEWVAEKTQAIRFEQEQKLRQEIEPAVRKIVQSQHRGDAVDAQIQELTEKLTYRIDGIMAEATTQMEALAGSFLTGNIELNNHNHLEKVIQTLILLQMTHAPVQVARGEQIFKRFSTTDLASLLHLHFTVFKDKKLNTVQVKIKGCSDALDREHPKVQKLMDALQDFFY